MKRIAVLITLIVLLGCAGAPLKPLAPELKKRVYKSDFNVTWGAVLDAISQRDIPLATVSKENGLIVTDYVDVGAKHRYFPAEPPAIQMRYKLNVTVKEIKNATEVKIIGKFEWKPHAVFSSFAKIPDWVTENSAGILEAEIFDDINERVRR